MTQLFRNRKQQQLGPIWYCTIKELTNGENNWIGENKLRVLMIAKWASDVISSLLFIHSDTSLKAERLQKENSNEP